MKWPLVRLGDCCTVVSGATPKTGVDSYWGGSVLWATPKDVSNLDSPWLSDTPDKVTEDGYASCSTQMLPVGAVLVTSRAPIGNIAIAAKSMCTNQGFKSLVPGPTVLSGYLYHCMKANSERLQALGNGATFKEVSKPIVENFEIPLPPLEEQKRIAAILDKADSLRRNRQQAIRLADDFLRAVFLDMFGDPVTNSRKWPEKEIYEIAKVTTGNTPSREMPENFGSAIEWIKSDNINTPSHWLTKATEGLSEKGLSLGRTAPAGSTLMTCIAGSPSCIGNVAIADREVAFNQQINALTPFEGTEPEFLYGLLLYSKQRVQDASTNSMKGMVSKGSLERVRLIWPPADLQSTYARAFKKITALRDKQLESDTSPLFSSLQDSLLS